MRGPRQLGRVDHHRPADPPAFGGRDGAGVRGALEGKNWNSKAACSRPWLPGIDSTADAGRQ